MANSKLYNALKFIALVLNPALATLYFALSGIWGLPYPEKVIGSFAAFDAFLGVVLHISSAAYYKNGSNFDGTMHVTDTGDKVINQLAMNGDPSTLSDKKVITFNVSTNKHEAPAS